jgi:DNA-binding transcriptional LysR family regulator
MELRHLRYFVTVADTLSFSRAAVHLRIAQPSLSTQIQNLEQELGFRLLNRDHNRVSLTDAGAVFRREARQVLARVDTALKRARAAAAGDGGDLRVATMGPLTFSFVPACLARFRADIPKARVTVTEMAPPDQLNRIARGDIHVGFVPAPFPRLAGARHLRAEKVLRSPLVVMLAPEHPLAAGPSVRLRDLAGETFLHIRLFETDTQRLWTHEICRKAGFTPRFGAAAVNPDNLITMVAAGEGVALIPKVAQRGPAPGCAYIPIAEKNLFYELLAVCDPAHESGLVRRFLEIVIAEALAVEKRLHEMPVAAAPPSTGRSKRKAARKRTR